MDVAALGISVDSAPVDKGTRSLNQFTGAAGRAQAATGSLAGSSRAAAGALTTEASAADRAANSVRRYNTVLNDNSMVARGSATNVANLAAQFQDIGVSAAMSMSPLQIALQQGTQISAVMGPMGAAGAMSALGAAFASILSPVSLAVIAIVGLVAAGLQFVDWSAAAQMAMNGLATALEVIGPYAAMAAAGLALLYAPQIIGGLVGVIALLGRVSVAAVTAALMIAAANPGAAIILGLTAAVAAANIFRDELEQIFGVDIVGAAKDGVNAIIGAFVGGYNYVKTTWEQLPLVFSAIGKKAWNALLDEVSKPLLTFGDTTLIPGLATNVARSELTAAESAALAGASGTMGDAMGRDYVGAIGGAISRGASDAAEKLRELAAGMGGVEEAADSAGSAAGGAGSAIGKAANDNMDPWKGLRGAVDTVSEGLRFAKQTATNFFQDLRQGLASGEGFWSSFKNAALNALDAIMSKLVESGVEQIFTGGMALGGGGFFGNILGGLGSLLGFDEGGWTGGHRGQVRGLVHGEEFVVKAGPAARHRQTLEAMNAGRPAPANNNGGGNSLKVEQHFHISGAVSSADVQRMVRAGASESVQVIKDNLPGWQTDIQLYGRPA